MKEENKDKKRVNVYVLNKHGRPLMPCSPGCARKLLRDGRAKVVRKDVFTIQLLYGTSGYTQNTTMNEDLSSEHDRLPALTQSQEIEQRKDSKKNVSTKKEFSYNRKKRRYRKIKTHKANKNNSDNVSL